MSGEQITADQLETMSIEEIAASTLRGEMKTLLGGGDPDPFGVEAARADVLAAKAETEAAKTGNADQGARGGEREGGQVTAAELATMSPGAITKATREGRLTDLLG